MRKNKKFLEDNFNHKAYTITSTGSVQRDWGDLLKSDNAQKQVEFCKKLAKENDK
jgi:hypothetical protein